jgi:hypothetical protein
MPAREPAVGRGNGFAIGVSNDGAPDRRDADHKPNCGISQRRRSLKRFFPIQENPCQYHKSGIHVCKLHIQKAE